MGFFDEVRIRVKAGDGGGGCISFRREKYVEFGGPDGGDGGRGGSIWICADANLYSLTQFVYRNYLKAANGEHGRGKKQSGACGEDVILCAPMGTQVFFEDGQLLGELDATKGVNSLLLATGGRGGYGNARFKSSTNKAPRHAIPGFKGEEHFLRLVLKIVADIGIIGMPNAGKSTLLSLCSSAKPKIADYQFTTLSPNLGMVEHHHDQLVMIDIPGLLEGAHSNVGLGCKFLKHMERCKLVLHMVDASRSDVVGAYQIVRKEMACYGACLADKQELVLLSKTDLVDPSVLEARQKALEGFIGAEVYTSSITCATEPLIAVLASKLRDINSVRYNDEEGAITVGGGGYDPASE